MRISFKALALGYLITVIASILTSLLNFTFLSTGVLDSFFNSSLNAQVYLSYCFFGITLLFYVVSGYFSAKVAQKDELLHGIVLGFIIWLLSTVINYINYGLYNMDISVFRTQTLISSVWPVFSCLLGTFIRKIVNDKIREENEPSLEQKIENLGNN